MRHICHCPVTACKCISQITEFLTASCKHSLSRFEINFIEYLIKYLSFFALAHSCKGFIQIAERFVQWSEVALCIKRFYSETVKRSSGFVGRSGQRKDHISQRSTALTAFYTSVCENTESGIEFGCTACQ